ncbi:AfsR/SARP family transcriptional regulator [Streptomyces sp. NBC_01275]|uniref:AfsR/SARP family transcriptional regulator n=1 Tax=Streptomyces sp. NBC_01275 TaxID=2903807 RepID=UPI00225B92B5|nr:AfsR/SARP family transcriptional regulator [Streptomyces sp. NBC_01275]MCX4763956.1 AfsR/SARP family transcriptional regulator [Streptomyces sp. NBC_01275]
MIFRVLGPLEIESSSGRQKSPRALKIRSLLAFLCVHNGKSVSTETLIDALWSSLPPQTAATALQVYVSKLRRHLADLGLDASVLTTQPRGYRLNLPPELLDVSRFEDLWTEGQRLLKEDRKEEAAVVLASALALWRGGALGDLRSIPAFDALGRRLDEKHMAAQELHMGLQLRLGRHRALIGELYALIAELPTWENLYAYLMIALYRSGRTAESLAVYGEIRDVLVSEFGMEPGAGLRHLHQAILSRAAHLDDVENFDPRHPEPVLTHRR